MFFKYFKLGSGVFPQSVIKNSSLFCMGDLPEISKSRFENSTTLA